MCCFELGHWSCPLSSGLCTGVVPVTQQSPSHGLVLLLLLALAAIPWAHVESCLAFGAGAHFWWFFLFHRL